MSFSTTEAHLAGKKATNAIQRVAAIETTLEQIIESTNNALRDIHSKVDAMSELLRATVDVVGMAAIEERAIENRTSDDMVATQNMIARIAESVANGELKKAEVIGESSFLVLTEKKDGQPLAWGSRKQFLTSNLLPVFRAELLGKGIGAFITSQSGNAFEVIEVYDVVPKATPAPETK